MCLARALTVAENRGFLECMAFVLKQPGIYVHFSLRVFSTLGQPHKFQPKFHNKLDNLLLRFLFQIPQRGNVFDSVHFFVFVSLFSGQILNLRFASRPVLCVPLGYGHL